MFKLVALLLLGGAAGAQLWDPLESPAHLHAISDADPQFDRGHPERFAGDASRLFRSEAAAAEPVHIVWRVPDTTAARVTAFHLDDSASAALTLLASPDGQHFQELLDTRVATAAQADGWVRADYVAEALPADAAFVMARLPGTPGRPSWTPQIGEALFEARGEAAAAACLGERLRGPEAEQEGVRLLVVASPKPFGTSDAVRRAQRVALRSWTAMAGAETVLVGDAEGVAAAAREFGARHEPRVPSAASGSGVPTVAGALSAAAAAGLDADAVVLTNADIALPPTDVAAAVAAVRRRFSRFLIVGRRTNVELADDAAAYGDLAALATGESAGGWIDYFVLSNDGLLQELSLPGLVLGRDFVDWGVLHAAAAAGAAVVDASAALRAFHGAHGYEHLGAGRHRSESPDSLANGLLLAEALGVPPIPEGDIGLRLSFAFPLWSVDNAPFVLSSSLSVMRRAPEARFNMLHGAYCASLPAAAAAATGAVLPPFAPSAADVPLDELPVGAHAPAVGLWLAAALAMGIGVVVVAGVVVDRRGGDSGGQEEAKRE